MSEITEKIRAKVNDFGKADLSVITICQSKKQANQIVAKNIPLLKRTFNMSRSTGGNTHVIEHEALNEFRHTGLANTPKHIQKGLQKAYPSGKIGFDKISGAYTIELA